MKIKTIIAAAVITFALTACNNFFHDLLPPDDNKILSFEVPGEIERAVITENTITVMVNKGVSVDSLIPKIEISRKAAIFPLTLEYISAAFPNADVAKEAKAIYQTDDLISYVIDLIKSDPGSNIPAIDQPMDFTGPVSFLVIGGQGSTRTYTVYVIEDNGEPRLLNFGFSKYDNPELVKDALSMVGEMYGIKGVAAEVTYPAEMTLSYKLAPNFYILGDRLEVDGVEIVSGETQIQFAASSGTQYKSIKVWRNGESADYTLAVQFSVDMDTIRSITDFRFTKTKNPDITVNAVGSIINSGGTGTIRLQVFYSGVKPSVLIPEFISPCTVSPGTVKVSGQLQTSGVSYHDFSLPVEYHIVSRNGQYERTYTVLVDFVNFNEASPRITSFRFSTALNPDLVTDSAAEISDSAGLIMIDVRYGGMDAPNLLYPEFSATGVVSVYGSVQISGMGGHDFSRQIKYTVSNPENPLLARDYWVQARLVRDTSGHAAISAFSFHPDENSLDKECRGDIYQNASGDAITVYLPPGFDLENTTLIPRFSASGAVSAGGGAQISGTTGMKFDSPVVYTVTSPNGAVRREYTVTAVVLAADTYVIAFEANGGSSVPSQTVNRGETILKPADPARNDYIFCGWYTDNGTFNNEWNFAATPAGDVTLYAKWLYLSMVRITVGTFMMGSPEKEPYSLFDETQHSVSLSGFYMCRYQITQAQWIAVMGVSEDRTTTTYGKGNNYPVYYVNWYDAIVFCNKLSMMEGLTPAYRMPGYGNSTNPSDWGTIPTGSNATWNAVQIVAGSTGYRLPTEAQWEYACRAGTTTPFNTGNNITTAQANYDGNYPYNNNPVGIYRQSTTPVGTFASNAWGLYDMHGNVWEWCWDWYGTYSSGAQTNPVGASSGSHRVFRGGGWGSSAVYVRSAFRDSSTPSGRGNRLGFRLVRP